MRRVLIFLCGLIGCMFLGVVIGATLPTHGGGDAMGGYIPWFDHMFAGAGIGAGIWTALFLLARLRKPAPKPEQSPPPGWSTHERR